MEREMISAREALQRLQEGNRRYLDGDRRLRPVVSRRDDLVAGQEPFAIVLGCSDSRVPVEHVFDQGLGDLFVVRVAGNVVTPPQLGSIEFAAEHFGARLVVVLGHTRCGAVEATITALRERREIDSDGLRSIVDCIAPVVQPLLDRPIDDETLIGEAVRANIQASVAALRQRSETIDRLVREEDLLVVGAEYALETGVVEFFEG
jgi:carbonic anhydrase